MQVVNKKYIGGKLWWATPFLTLNYTELNVKPLIAMHK